jgi:hypothetical protein
MKLLFGALVLFAGIATGCAEVKPWERGLLSHPAMDPKSPARTLREEFMRHTLDTREGSTGGNDAAGGGCGCN